MPVFDSRVILCSKDSTAREAITFVAPAGDSGTSQFHTLHTANKTHRTHSLTSLRDTLPCSPDHMDIPSP